MRKRVVGAMKGGTFTGCRRQTLGKSLCHFGMGFKLPYSFFRLNSSSLNLFSTLRSFFPRMNSLCLERVDENWSKAVRVGTEEDDGVPLSSMTGCFIGSESLTGPLCLWKKILKKRNCMGKVEFSIAYRDKI